MISRLCRFLCVWLRSLARLLFRVKPGVNDLPKAREGHPCGYCLLPDTDKFGGGAVWAITKQPDRALYRILKAYQAHITIVTFIDNWPETFSIHARVYSDNLNDIIVAWDSTARVTHTAG